jgi:hypothetical protein
MMAYITMNEASEKFGIAKQTIWKYIRDGIIKKYKQAQRGIGKIVEESDIRRVLSERAEIMVRMREGRWRGRPIPKAIPKIKKPVKPKKPEKPVKRKDEITVREASELSGFAPRTIQTWFSKGLITGRRENSRIIIKLPSFEKLIREKTERKIEERKEEERRGAEFQLFKLKRGEDPLSAIETVIREYKFGKPLSLNNFVKYAYEYCSRHPNSKSLIAAFLFHCLEKESLGDWMMVQKQQRQKG